MAQLKLVGINDKDEYPLSKPEVFVGRAEQNDIVIGKELLSRRHAKFSYSADAWMIEDLGSTNGTYINNRQVRAPTAVKAGDVIKFGREVYYLIDPDDAEQTIMASRLPPSMLGAGGSVMIDEGDSQLTSFEQSYQLPAGWEGENAAPEYSAELVDRLLKKMASAKPVPEVALIFFISGRRPLVFGISRAKDGGEWTVGRDSSCNIRVNDPSISAHHATLSYQSGNWYLADAESTNGLRIHGELQSNISMNDGLEVALGRAELLFREVV